MWTDWLSPNFLINTLGLVGVTLIIFAESGLLIGFFFPGDSLLFTAGIFASQGYLNIWWLVPLSAAAAILGDSAGYWFGAKVGPGLFARPNSRWFKQERLIQTKKFFIDHGKRSIVLARFMPVVRTFTPILAGVAEMDYATFLSYNVLGGLIWGAGIPLLGFVLGNSIPNIDHYLLPIIIVIVATSFGPALVHWWRR